MFKKFADAALSGISFSIKIAKVGDGAVQLDILPIGQDNKTGHGLPAQALIGSPQEIEAGLPGFLEQYLPAVARVDADFKEAVATITAHEDAAKAAAKEKVAERIKPVSAKSSSSTTSASGKTKPASKPKDLSLGMLGDDDDDATDMGGASSESTEPSEGAPAGAQPVDTLTQSLFVL